MLDFDLQYVKKTFVRRKNWQSFIKKKEEFNYKRKNKIALFFLTYNLSNSVIKLLNILEKDSHRKSFDIIIIDNHSSDEHFGAIKTYIKDNNISNIIILRSKTNIGGAGGNAIGLEYIISQNYDYCIFTEDDAFPLCDNFVSQIINCISEKTIIRTFCKDIDGVGYPFHFSLYPIDFIKRIGVVNPGYFMRSDDEEFAFRIQKGIKSAGYKYKDLSIKYTHPTIKKGFGKYWQIYFSVRNSFTTKMKGFFDLNYKYYLSDLFRQYKIFFVYIWLGFSKIFIEKNHNFLITIVLAIYDYIFNKFNYQNNTKRLSYLNSLENNLKIPIHYEYIKLENLDKMTHDLYLIDYSLTFQKTHKIKHSKKLSNFFTRGVLLSSFSLPLYPLAFLAKKVILIEEFVLEKNEAYIGYINNQRTLLHILSVIISFVFSLLLYIPLSILILMKIFLFKLLRNIGK